MEQHIEYALEVVNVEIVKLQKLLEDGHLLPEDRESIRLDIQRLNQAVIDIREKYNA